MTAQSGFRIGEPETRRGRHEARRVNPVAGRGNRTARRRERGSLNLFPVARLLVPELRRGGRMPEPLVQTLDRSNRIVIRSNAGARRGRLGALRGDRIARIRFRRNFNRDRTPSDPRRPDFKSHRANPIGLPVALERVRTALGKRRQGLNRGRAPIRRVRTVLNRLRKALRRSRTALDRLRSNLIELRTHFVGVSVSSGRFWFM